MAKWAFSSVPDALEAMNKGEFVVVVDDPDRENECDLVIAADKVTPEKIAFLVRYTSGLICQSVLGERLDELQLPPMVQNNTESHQTAFTVSVDYNIGTTTGISAHDRCKTMLALIDKKTTPEQLSRPGHMFPLRYREGGVLTRTGHTEASLDMAAMAGCYPSGVICEIVKDDGSILGPEDMQKFCIEHNLKAVTVADVVDYRRQHPEIKIQHPK